MTPPFDFLGAVRTLREAIHTTCEERYNERDLAAYPRAIDAERAAESSLLTAVRALEAERDALDAYATREHQHRVEAELENQGLHGQLDALRLMMKQLDELASPGFRVRIEADGAGMFDAFHEVLAEDCRWKSVSEATEHDSLPNAIAGLMLAWRGRAF